MLVLIAGVIWSSMGLALRQIEVAGTWQVLFWRSLGTLPVLFAVLAWRNGAPFRAILQSGWAGLIGGAALVLAFGGAIYSIQTTSVANAVFLFAASPLFTALLAWPLLREPVRRATWVAILIAGLGMFLMLREGLALGAGLGNAAALLSAFGFAIFTIALRWGRLGEMLPAVLLGALFAAAVALAMITVQGSGIAIPRREIVIALFMGGALVGGGMALYTRGSLAVPAAELTLLSMVEVLLAPLWVLLFLGEGASPATLTGGAVLLAAILFNALSGARHRPPVPLT